MRQMHRTQTIIAGGAMPGRALMLSDVAMKTLDLNLLITRVGLLAERMVTGAARRLGLIFPQ